MRTRIKRGLGVATIFALHVAAALREAPLDREEDASADFIEVGHVDEIEEGRAKIVRVAGERVAIFKYDDCISALSNVCQHQNGPLGEGRVIDGCVTCPWHGYQYDPASGASPAPFEEKVPTFGVRLDGGRIFVSSRPNPPGTHVAPARIAAEA